MLCRWMDDLMPCGTRSALGWRLRRFALGGRPGRHSHHPCPLSSPSGGHDCGGSRSGGWGGPPPPPPSPPRRLDSSSASAPSPGRNRAVQTQVGQQAVQTQAGQHELADDVTPLSGRRSDPVPFGGWGTESVVGRGTAQRVVAVEASRVVSPLESRVGAQEDQPVQRRAPQIRISGSPRLANQLRGRPRPDQTDDGTGRAELVEPAMVGPEPVHSVRIGGWDVQVDQGESRDTHGSGWCADHTTPEVEETGLDSCMLGNLRDGHHRVPPCMRMGRTHAR